MPYVLSTPGLYAKHNKSVGTKIVFNQIKEIIYNSFDELELYVAAPEDSDESLNSENELLLTVCDILERIEQKLFD